MLNAGSTGKRATPVPLSSSPFPLPSSPFPLPSSPFPLPSSLFPPPASIEIQPEIQRRRCHVDEPVTRADLGVRGIGVGALVEEGDIVRYGYVRGRRRFCGSIGDRAIGKWRIGSRRIHARSTGPRKRSTAALTRTTRVSCVNNIRPSCRFAMI